MRLGFTYDLRDDYRALGYDEEAIAEFDSPETIDEIAAALTRLGFSVDRIGHIKALAARLVAGERWDLVFNIAEGLKGRSREAQVPALLEAYDVPYVFSDPLTLAVSLDKAMAKQIVRDAGIPTAPFAVARQKADVAGVNLSFPLFVKPLAEGTGKGCEKASKVRDKAELEAAVARVLEQYHQPALIEAYLPGREFTVGIVGNGDEAEIVAVMEITMTDAAHEDVYGLLNKEECETRVRYSLADDAEAQAAGAVALAAYHALDCRDAARLDMRACAKGDPHFLEANPLAGLHPRHSDLPILASLADWPYDRLIGRIMAAACARHGISLPKKAGGRRAA